MSTSAMVVVGAAVTIAAAAIVSASYWLLRDDAGTDAAAKPSTRADVRISGLTNLGNTCYTNSILQALASCQTFVRWLANTHTLHIDTPLLEGLREVMEGMPAVVRLFRASSCFLFLLSSGFSDSQDPLRGRTGQALQPGARMGMPFNPTNLVRALPALAAHMGDGDPQDAHEFLMLLFGAMAHTEPPRPPRGLLLATLGSRPSALFQSIPTPMSGTLESLTVCLGCGCRRANTVESFLSLSLPVPDTARSLHDCLAAYTAEETVGPVDCAGCGGRALCRRALRLGKCPALLALHFSAVRPGLLFPLLLDPTRYTVLRAARPPYTLVAVVAYAGGRVGHFYAFRRVRGEWVAVSDRHVRPASDQDVFRAPVFLALYERVEAGAAAAAAAASGFRDRER